MRYLRFYLFQICNLLVILFFLSCKSGEEKIIDLSDIKERGYITAVTSYSPHSYFIYQGKPMGYEYELLQMLGEYLDLPVKITLAKDFDEMESLLETGEGDIIAYNLTITSERRERISFTNPMNTTKQVLVQRKPENWRQMKLHQIENNLIRSPDELKNKTIIVRKGSAYLSRLLNLSHEIGYEIDIKEAERNITTEELIRKVANDSIDYTVADENIAKILSAYYDNLDVKTPISLPQQTAWAVRKTSPNLLDTINTWLAKIKKTADYNVIYNKYFKNRHEFRSRYSSRYFPITGDAISPYDSLLKEGANRIDWDWRLLAALAYRESKFNPLARSWAGAVGLMQLMPRTAAEFGANNIYNPEENIKAGVKFLEWLENYWKAHIENEKERKTFVIASYNVGHGHIQDARKLAEKFNANPNVWEDNVEKYIIKKSNPDYYNLDVVNYGYANGIEPVKYVETIYELYEHYKKFID